MEFLKKLHEVHGKKFEKGGPLEKLYPLWEAHDTLLFTPGHVTKGNTHVRDALDLKRMMITVVVAMLPIVLFAMYNTGLQANKAIEAGATALATWQTALYTSLGFTFVNAPLENMIHGALYFLPIFIVTFAAGGLVEVISALIRGHEVNEGFLVTGFLIPLTVPPTLPLWQLALCTAFGILIAKEAFGGTGMNILNPALTVRAFLFFAY
ncbi:MAG: RnfABCDGE type electron transport complex subunit D, partial [Myxococcota bacterium]|nr:RnfABCDGE type electron transport complex subunit D [Myxococcota bacterium]